MLEGGEGVFVLGCRVSTGNWMRKIYAVWFHLSVMRGNSKNLFVAVHRLVYIIIIKD